MKPVEGELYLRADGARLRARRIPGRGERAPTLVFLHEALGSISQWRDFPDRLCELSALPGLIYERRGHGGSDAASGARDASYLHHEARTVLPQVLDACGIERAALFGHSDGGSIALLAAAADPRRYAALLVEAAHVFVEDVTLEGIERAALAWETTDLRQRLVRHHAAHTDALFSAWRDIWLSAGFRAWNIEAALPEVLCPVLVIQGADDEYGSLAQVDAICAGVRGAAQRLVLPHCGHAPHVEQPQPLLRACVEFLQARVGVHGPR